MSSKKINEISGVAAISGAAAVYSPKRSHKGKGFKPKQAFVSGKFKAESRSEQTLREAIRNLIFLNRVKYHEENAKREMQEQKIRRVIRYLLKEADSSRDINFSTTGAASAWNFITAIEKTTFTNDFATTLKSSTEQRDAFKIVYLTGVKIYLDALDQQYLILNPEDQPGGSLTPPMPNAPADTGGAAGPTPDMGGPPPAKRSTKRELDEQGEEPAANADTHPTAAEAAPPPSAPADTSAIQSAAVKSALSATQQAKLDKTGVNAAESALNRDLPQIDPLYFNLTFKPVTTSSGRNTNDRQEFRFFLIGDQNKVGNIQLKFKEWNDKMPIGGQSAGTDTPKVDPTPINLPDISGGGSAAPAPMAGGSPTPAPVAGLPAV